MRATAPANWTRSPAGMVGNWERKGIKLLTLSEIPRLAKKAGSTVGKMSMEPSAPPPLKTMLSAMQPPNHTRTYLSLPWLWGMAIASSVCHISAFSQ